MKKTTILFITATFMLVALQAAMAQDPTKVDPKHYKVVFENDQVRVLRITYGPGEKSVMHEHPAAVVVDLTDSQVQFTLPNGKTISAEGKKGQVMWDKGGKHLPQNVGDKSMETILVEMKNKPGANTKGLY